MAADLIKHGTVTETKWIIQMSVMITLVTCCV